MKHFAKHRVTREEYDAVKKGWVDKGGCQLWELIIKEVYDPPLYLVFQLPTLSSFFLIKAKIQDS